MTVVTRRAALFAVIAASCLGGAAAYVLHARSRTVPAAGAGPALPAPRAGAASAGPLLVFRRSSIDADNRALGIAPVDDLSSPRFVPALRCERVAMAAGRGVCLAADRGVFTTYRAVLFDADFAPGAVLPLAGIPSRVQVSPDGRLAATTVFVTGHSYASGDFSTRTSILDLETARWLVEDLETFAVRRNGALIQSPDFNFWGVTFTRDGRTFYATLGTGGEVLLVRGDVRSRTAEVIAEQIECPSLSPDGRHLAFKQRTGGGSGPVTWRLWVLDLDSGRRHPLAETRSVDDQAQWLDDAQVLYALPAGDGRTAILDQWVVPADGGGEPRLLVAGAYSAGVARSESR